MSSPSFTPQFQPQLHHFGARSVNVRKREKRIKVALHNIGTVRAGHGWAARQAGKKHNKGSKKQKKTGYKL